MGKTASNRDDRLSADAIFGVLAGSIVLDVVNDFSGDVATSDFFDAKTRRGVDFEDHGALVGTHEVDSSDVETHSFGGADGDAFFFRGEFDASAFTALVKVATKIIVERLTFHAGDNARADDEGADVSTGGFLDIFLKKDVGAVFVVEVEGLEGGFGGFFGLG